MCDGRAGELLELEEGSIVYLLETVKYASEIPVAVCVDVILRSFVSQIDPERIQGSVFEGLENTIIST